MAFISTIVIGFIVGLLARFLMPGRDAHGFIVTTLLGIVGAFIASYAGQMMGFYLVGQPAGFVASVIGALVVLAIYRMVAGRPALR